MSDSWPITEHGSLIIRQDAPVDWRVLNKELYKWARENKYFFYEKGFVQKIKSHGSEFDIDWVFEKKVTSFIKFRITITNWATGMNPIKINEKELMKGKIETVIDSYMEMDWQNRWETSKLLRLLRSIYIYYIKKNYFLSYAGKCWEETYSLHALIKSLYNQSSLF